MKELCIFEPELRITNSRRRGNILTAIEVNGQYIDLTNNSSKLHAWIFGEENERVFLNIDTAPNESGYGDGKIIALTPLFEKKYILENDKYVYTKNKDNEFVVSTGGKKPKTTTYIRDINHDIELW